MPTCEMSRDACWGEGGGQSSALLSEGSEPGADVLTGVIDGSTGHVSFQSGETLEYDGNGERRHTTPPP